MSDIKLPNTSGCAIFLLPDLGHNKTTGYSNPGETKTVWGDMNEMTVLKDYTVYISLSF